jgi:hypothetical protein
MLTLLAAIETDWAAIAVCLILASPAVGAIATGIRAPDTLQNRFEESRRNTRATIEGDRIVPRLGDLAFDLQETGGSDGSAGEDARRESVRARLQKTDYMNAVEELSVLAADYRDLQRFQDEAQRWSRLKALAAGAYLAGFIYPAVVASLDGLDFPRPPLLVSMGVAGLGAAFAVTFFVQETGSRNRLVGIVRKYE